MPYAGGMSDRSPSGPVLARNPIIVEVLKSNWERRWRDLVTAGGAAVAMGCSNHAGTGFASQDAADPVLIGGGCCNGSGDPCCGVLCGGGGEEAVEGAYAACRQGLQQMCSARGGSFDGIGCTNLSGPTGMELSEASPPEDGSDEAGLVDAATAEGGNSEAGPVDAGDSSDGQH